MRKYWQVLERMLGPLLKMASIARSLFAIVVHYTMSNGSLAIARNYSHTSTGTRTVSAHEQMRALCQVTQEPRRADASVNT